MDQTFGITEMIDLTRTLGDLITRETDILHSKNPHQIGPLQDEKFELATRYAAALSALRQDPTPLSGASPELRRSLRATTTKLRTQIDGNVRALDIAKQVNERLIRAVGEAVSQHRAPPTGYSAAGTLPGTGTTRGAATTAIALDRRI